MKGEMEMEELTSKFAEYLSKKRNAYLSDIMKTFNLKEYEVYGIIEMM